MNIYLLIRQSVSSVRIVPGLLGTVLSFQRNSSGPSGKSFVFPKEQFRTFWEEFCLSKGTVPDLLGVVKRTGFSPTGVVIFLQTNSFENSHVLPN